MESVLITGIDANQYTIETSSCIYIVCFVNSGKYQKLLFSKCQQTVALD